MVDLGLKGKMGDVTDQLLDGSITAGHQDVPHRINCWQKEGAQHWCSPSPAPSQSPSSAKPSILWLLAKRQQFLQVEDAHWSPLLSWASAGDCISKHRPFSLTPLLEAALTQCTTQEEVRSSHPLGHPEKESCFGGLGLLKSLRPQGAAFSSRGLRSWG